MKLALLAALLAAANPVLPGLDALREEKPGFLQGKRLGFITNQTGQAIDGTSAVLVLKEAGLDVRALFSPEHGFSGTEAAGAAVRSGTDARTGLAVFSIYGETRKPTPAMLRGLDGLVFDVQDIGVRFYTYISTLKLAMEAAAEAGLFFVVLDRPNPRGGLQVEGPVLEPRFSSFVGIAPVALVHGMTVGELAQFFNGERLLAGGRRVELHVIPVRGWARTMTWEKTGLAWRPTSPNIRTLESAVNYPALGLFEGVNVSEGRGTRETFLIAGAPWIDGEKIAAELSGLSLPGVRFSAETFVPHVLPEAPEPLYPDETCRGFRMTVDAPATFQAVRAGLSAIAAIKRHHGNRFEWKRSGGRFVLDRLLGTDRARLGIDASESVDAIVQSFEPELRRFLDRRSRYLIYE